MAAFTFNSPDGKSYTVQGPDGATPEQAFAILQQHIGTFTPPTPPDKYAQAGQDEYAQMKTAGYEPGYARRVMQGATLGAGDEIMAGLSTPLEMISHGTINPAEGYRYAKAFEDAQMADARKNQGVLGTAAEIAGGLGTAGGIGKAGYTLAKDGAGLISRAARLGTEGAAYGGVSGFMDGGNSLNDRISGAAKGAAIGGAVGGAIPVVSSAAGTVAAPVLSNIRARINPTGVAVSQLARAVDESGRPVQNIVGDVQSAAAGGQPEYTVADALGFPGQRLLRTGVSAPGPGRAQAVEFLNSRQAGQAGRVGQIIDEGLGANNATARQTADGLMASAKAESTPLYQQALNYKPVWNDRLQQFFNDPVTTSGLKDGLAVQRLESLAAGQKFDPVDYAVTGFNEAGDPIVSGVPNMRTINLIKKGWDNTLEGYRDPTTGKLMLDEKGRALDAVRRSFLNEVDAVNPYYAKARATYAGPAQVKDAVYMGQRAATTGRAADNLQQFNALPDASQQGYRAGYADKLAGRVERGAEGSNAVRPLTSDKTQQELSALSLHQGPVQPNGLDPLSTLLNREKTMFATRAEATGGSKTDMNLADQEAQKVDPSLLADLATLNVRGLARRGLSTATNALHGYTPAVREQIVKLLLARGANPGTEQAIAGEMAKLTRNRTIAAALMRGATLGTATYLPRAR